MPPPAAGAKLLPVKDARGKVGLLNGDFKLVVSPRFDSVGPVSEGLVVAREGGKSGYLDALGQWAIQPTFAKAESFSEGVAAVAVEDPGGERFGFIDRGGRWIVPAQFEAASSFREGLARVRAKGVEQYVDHSGKVVFVTPGSASYDFRAGLTRVLSKGSFGYADNQGQLVIPARFEQARDFFEGLAAVQVGGRWAYIDTKGTFQIAPRFASASQFNAGRAVVALSDHAFAFVDPQGKLFGNYRMASDFQNGLAGVLMAGKPGDKASAQRSSARWGFIEPSGKVVIDPRFEKVAGGFRDGLAAVAEPAADFGYIDVHGGYVIAPRFTAAQDFVEGIARVEQRKGSDGRTEFGYIDRQGAFVWGPLPVL